MPKIDRNLVGPGLILCDLYSAKTKSKEINKHTF